MPHMDMVPQSGARLVAFAALQLSDQRFEILRLTEIPVDRSETDIGDLVQARERLHHQPADDRRRNLILAHALEAPDNACHHALDALTFYGSLSERVADRPLQLVALK